MRQVLDAGGPSAAYQSEVENGKRSNVSVGVFIAWCNAIGVNPSVAFATLLERLQKPLESIMQESRFADGTIERMLIEASSEAGLKRKLRDAHSDSLDRDAVEIKQFKLDPDAICPCGRGKKLAKNCCIKRLRSAERRGMKCNTY